MASKRAMQMLALRAPSCVLRTHGALPQRARSSTPAPPTILPRPQIAIAQRRWQSQTPPNQETKLYEFADVAKLIQSPESTTSPLLVDVREPNEFAAGAIPTAINIPITSQPDALLLPADEFEDRFGFAKPDTEREVVFYCKAGVRSRAAAGVARAGGYEKVGEYRGSWMDWVGKGGKV
ncbi:Rhodanese-like protein [Polyplosphaeria fusca]|uniref:Rhodanese-like protein n=1 Tax=Polyplosphaeria fusca TaxID=682080 RepID=A0A9P4QVZ7_9PLEO|nr:Rhodanese-like protein [Polyplosphaeria fusca]